MTLHQTLIEARKQLRGSWEFAYANSHGCSCPHDPRLNWVHNLDQALRNAIRETKP